MLADVYRSAAELGISALELDATPLWKVGAMLRPPRTDRDETREIFEARMRGEDIALEDFRARPMADVIQLRPGGAPDAP